MVIYNRVMITSSQAFSGILNNFRILNNDLDSRPFTNSTFGCCLYMINLVRVALLGTLTRLSLPGPFLNCFLITERSQIGLLFVCSLLSSNLAELLHLLNVG